MVFTTHTVHSSHVAYVCMRVRVTGMAMTSASGFQKSGFEGGGLTPPAQRSDRPMYAGPPGVRPDVPPASLQWRATAARLFNPYLILVATIYTFNTHIQTRSILDFWTAIRNMYLRLYGLLVLLFSGLNVCRTYNVMADVLNVQYDGDNVMACDLRRRDHIPSGDRVPGYHV